MQDRLHLTNLTSITAQEWFLPVVIASSVIAFLLLLSLTIFLVRHHQAKPKRAKGVKRAKKAKLQIETSKVEANALLTALGGLENITSHVAKSSRLVISLIDASKVDKEALQKEGFPPFVLSSNKLTIVTNEEADSLERRIFNS